MELKFKRQPFQTDAVEAVGDCFSGQDVNLDTAYRIGFGAGGDLSGQQVFRNAELQLLDGQLLEKRRSRRELMCVPETVPFAILGTGMRVNH